MLVLSQYDYYALVVTDPDKATKFLSKHPLSEFYEKLRDKNFSKNPASPENWKHTEKKFRKALKKYIKRGGRNGIRLFRSKDIKDPNFKPVI